jgi:hypothetical protein
MFFRKPIQQAVAAAFVFALTASVAPIASAQSVRPEVGKPLQDAGNALKAKRYADAMAKVREADNASGKTQAEQVLIERMRAAVAASSGDVATEVAVVNSGKLPASEQLRMVQNVANQYYTQHEYANAVTWAQRYIKDGGTDPSVRQTLLQAYYYTGDCASVSRLMGEYASSEDSGRALPEDQIQTLRSCYLQTKDTNGYLAATERLVAFYPKPAYWAELLSRVQNKSGFSSNLQLDVYRLKVATGQMATTQDYMEAAQMALGDEYPAEAKKIVDQGYANKVLGTGNDIERQKRLADLATRRFTEGQAALAKQEQDALAARDGNDLVAVGYNYVGYGQAAKGISLMEQGIKKGGLRRPEIAKLHLGIAYLQAGQKAKALQVLKTVGGNDGSADLARLWTLQARRMA